MNDQKSKIKYYLAKRLRKDGSAWKFLGYTHKLTDDDPKTIKLLQDGETLSSLKNKTTANWMTIPFAVDIVAPGWYYQAVKECKSQESAEALFNKMKNQSTRDLIGHFADVRWLDQLTEDEMGFVFEDPESDPSSE